jgi:hypothetical protein
MTNLKVDQLQAAVQNADDGDFLRELIGFAAQRVNRRWKVTPDRRPKMTPFLSVAA